MATKSFSITMEEKTLEKLDSRIDRNAGDSRSGRIDQDLLDYWSLLELGFRTARFHINRREAMLIVDAMNGVYIGPGEYLARWIAHYNTPDGPATAFRHELSDCINLNGDQRKWRISASSFFARLDALNPLSLAAIVDWARRMWAHHEDTELWEKEFNMFPLFVDLEEAPLKEAIEAVEENNRLNDARWSDWSDALHIEESYEIKGLCQEGMRILNYAIETDGKSLAVDLPEVEIFVKGQRFSGSFWDKIAKKYGESEE